MPPRPPWLHHASHAKYFLKLLETLPEPYSSLDTNRLTVAYFCISGLDILGALDQVNATAVINWVYAQQLRVPPDAPADWTGGFRGAGYLGCPFAGAAGAAPSSAFDTGHLAMTYTALAILTILGDDLSRVDRAATLRHVRGLQQPDGSFCAYTGGESDMRFVYCAAAICTFLRDSEWRGMDAEAATAYVLSSQSYDGAIGLGPGAESHGGSMYTGLSALALLGTLGRLHRREAIVQWCLGRQVSCSEMPGGFPPGGGFQGRPNKDEDTCYSFWIGATLTILGAGHLSDADALCGFAQCCQAAKGGVSKAIGAHPDVLHSYFAIAGLALVGVDGLRPLDARLGLTLRARQASGIQVTTDADAAALEATIAALGLGGAIACEAPEDDPPIAQAPIIGGYGDFIFQYEPSRLAMPAGTSLNNAHGLVVDPLTNEIILTYEPNHDSDTHCMVRFKPDGTGGVTIGDGTGLCEGTPHGLRLSAEGSDLFLYHANNDATLHKTTLDGKLLWTVKGAPTADPAFQPNKPTWFAAPPGSKFVYMADGYGSNYVHSYTHDGVYANYSFGGRGTDLGKFQTCHCINYDARVGKIIVTDRENHRHQYFDLNPTGGPQLTYSSVFTTPGLDRPCTHHVAPDGVHAVVPSLEGPVGILDGTNALVSLVNVSGLLGDQGHLHPHDAIMLPSGDLVVATWAPGRLSYWRKLPKEQAEA